MAKKKKNSIVTYGDYQQNNGQVTTYGDYRQSQQKSEEKTSLTNPFREKKKKEAQSILNNFLEDVKNRKHMPATYVKTKANQNGPSFRDLTSKDTFSGWMNANKPREVENKKGNHLDSYNEYLRKVRSGIEGGTFDEGDDYRLWSDDRLQKSIEEEQNKLASRKANPETEAQKQQKKEDLQGVKKQKGIYTYLDVNGLEDVKNKRTYRGKPDDYDEGNLSEEYNAMLYDAIHGEGSYAKRVDALETDDQVDELDTEMEDYWDRLGKQKLHELGENREDLNARENELTDDLLYSEDKANKKIGDYQGVLQARKTVADLEKENQDINSIGQYGAGNIDLYHRTPVIDSDGNIETVNSFSINIDGKEILLPKVIDGKIVSEEEAIRHYEETGEHLGMFDTIEDANTYAENLHKQQERLYREDGKETQKSGSAVQELAKVVFGRPGEDEADRAYREITEQQAKSNSMTAAERNALFNQMAGNSFLPTGDELSNSLADTTKAYGQYYAFMSPAQVKTFKDFYESGDKDKAMAYLDGIKATGFLDAASNQYSQYMAEEAASGKHGWFYGLKSVAEAPIAGVMGLAGAGAALLGNEEAQKPDSVIYRPQAILSATRGARTEQWGEAAANTLGEWARQPAQFLNNVFYSMADMTMAGAIGSGGGMSSKVCEPLVQFVMSSEAASATMNDQLQAGKDPTEAALYALGSGAIEWVTEKYSIEQLLNPNVKEMLGNKKQLAKFIAKNTAAEASEEAAGSALEIGLDAVLSLAYGHENEIEERYNELIAQGMDSKNATGQVLWEKLQEIGTEALAGGLSGFLLSSARVGVNAIDQRNTGKTIKEAKTSGSKGQDVLVQTGLSMGEDTQSNKIAKEIQEKVDNGKEVSDRDVGRLAQNIQVESNENIGKAAQTVVEERAYDKLSGAEISVEEKREAAGVIARAVAGEELSKKERAILTGNTAVFSVYKQFVTPGETSREAMGAIMDATQKDAEAAASVSELLDQRKAQETREAEDPGEQLATEEDMTQATGTRTEGSRSVIVDGQWAKLGSLVADENGNLGWKVTIDGTEKTVKASQIRATDFSTAAIIRQAAVNPGMFSRWFTNDLIAENERGEIKNVGRFLLDAQKVRVAGYLGMQMPANTLGSAAQDLYDHAKQEHAMNRDAQLKGGNAGRQGKVTFMGAEYGTREWNQAIKSANLDSNQRAQIDAIAGIAQRAGIEVTFRDAAEVAKEMGVEDPEKYYGWENGSGISVNVEGLDFQIGENGNPEVRGQHNMLVTFGHEMTHWLQRNSMQGYNSLESFVMGEMRRNGVNIQKRVMDVMENRELSIEDAMSEIVADACDQIMGNEKVAQHIQETNQGLFKEIKSFVKDLVGRVKAAIKGMDQSASRDARAMMRSANNLAKVWLGAYDEAISGEIQKSEGASEETRLSVAQLDAEYEEAVRAGDLAHAEDMLLEKLQRTEGIIPFNAPHGYAGQHKDIARMIKNGTPEVVARAAADMAQYVPENAVLIPIPPHEGMVTDDTDTMILARAIGELTSRPVINALGSNERESRYQAKAENRKGVSAEEMGFRQIAEIPKGAMPIFIDNVVGSGETAKAARNALGGGITLSYAKSTRSQGIEGLKRATITYDKNGNLIPLSQRFDVSKRDVRYSQAVIDEDGEEMTLPSLNLARDLYFKGTDEDIEAGEKKLAQREHEMKDIIESDDFTALMLKNKAGGRYEILHPSTRKGIRFQLTYYGNDGEPSMHESYGKTGGPVDERENVHSMEELYRHYADMSYDSDLKLQVLRDNARFSQAMIDEEYDQAVKSGDVQRQQELVDQAADNAGYRIRAYHGTGRADRVGTVFRADRATSGPMAFFTDNKQIAENYSKDKKDTSIAYDEEYGDYKTQFRVKNKYGKEVPVGELWNTLTYGEKKKITEAAKHIAWDDEMENIIYDENAQQGNGGFNEWTLRDKRGNAIDALMEAWLYGGDLYEQEERFLEVLKMAGIDNVKWNDPNYREEKVYDTYLKIQNPFDTSTMYTGKFLEDLENWWMFQEKELYEHEDMGADFWDKNGISVDDWISYGFDDTANGNTRNWTRIPDGVTAYLKELGYDGIKDQGGKGGGIGHTVWIPFSSEQIKSAEPVTYDDQGNVIPLSERFNPEKVDIRWSKADLDPKQAELSEAWRKARDEANDLREQLRQMKPEMDAWADRITEAQKAGKMDEVLAEYKEWEKGYTKLRDEQYEAEQRYKQANKAYDDYIEQRDVAEEQKKIQASGLSEPEYRRKQAVDAFGYTTDFREAGYLLPNGRMLNFTGEKGKHYGTRGEDHRGISTIYASSEYQGGAAMMAFMRDGNIRVMAETPGVDIIASKEPTTEQYAAIRNMARRFAGEEYFNVDFTDDRGFNVDSIEYDGRVNPERIVNDIKTFYRTGSAPQQSVVSQFHFSKYTHGSMDVEEWMSKAKPWNLVTEDERELLDKYNGLRTRRGLLTKTVLELKADIKRKESILDKLTPDELKDLERAKIKLEEKQQKLLETEDELFRVTSTEGYAGMMYRNNVVLNDWILGKTQDDVREAVEQMVDQVKASERSIAAQVKALRKLADSQAVKAVSSMVEKKSLAYAVTSLKKQLNSDMGKTELESRLVEIALKKANGEDIQEDARLLAVDLTNKMRGYEIDTMERMRGITITIGPDQQAEMKGKGMTLQSVRDSLKGTGVKVRYGEYSSLDTDEEDLRTVLPELPQDIGENSADALFKFISWAQSMRDGDLAAKQSMVDIEEETTNVLAIASTIKVNMNSPEYRKQNEAAAKTRQAADELEQAGKAMSEQTELAGRRAIGFTSVLQRDVHQAIEYYNKVAKVAAQEEKNKVRKNLIEELKSENTRKLMQQRDKYEEMMKSDRRNRELAEDNMQIRNRINTIASRINKRLTAETDLKNIPQEAKPLARQVLKMLINHDMVYRHVLFADKKQRQATMQALNAYDMRDGRFNPDRDLNWLIVGEGDNADYDIFDKVYQDLINIEQGLLNYRNAEGQKGVTLMDRREALRKIDSAVSEIWSVIRAREEANINGKRMLISEMALQARDDMAKSRFKGEWTGVIGHGIGALRSGVIYGNMTPEYFFKNLKNKTISQLYDEYHRAENRNGLEVGRAQRRIAEIAEKYGYSAWDQEKRYSFKLVKGGTVNLTLGEMMSLYATWQREEANRAEVNGPEESFHLNVGGFYTVQEEKNKILGRELFEQKAHRLTEADMNAIKARMTEEQLDYVRDIVEYITKDIGALGNEASMRMYGIKKYNEKWYFPFEIWEGVKSKKSDQGAAGNQENRAAHPGFDKRRVNNASNALVIRNFTETAVKHIAGMINYNTFAPAIEFMNRVMNTQLDEFGEGEDSNTKRNLRAIIGEIYGKDAVKYLDDFQKDVNGGVTRADASIIDKLLSTFKKSAVAGSLSVALQQPLSYIRAAMMISPKYLAQAINPAYYKGSLEEMEKYSGVAVIKRMGKFDMNFGRSAQDFMMPKKKVGKGRKVINTISDVSTMGPDRLDRATWTRMWTACKLEMAAQNPGADMKSDAFLEKVAERFNDVMRKTQVYDSVLVKSRNMRSTHYAMKALTSFMSEPTLTANVLYDAVINRKESGGKKRLAMAGTTFIMSAILQAIVKGVIGAGRSPDDKKTFAENAAYKFASNFISEVNPMSLIPGYSDLMEVLMKGELSDDAMGVVGKILEAVDTGGKMIRGETNLYRGVEDSVGQLAQLFSNVPVKNIMRDARAMWNYFVDQPYAKRPSNPNVLKYQTLDLLLNSQNMTGVVNQRILQGKGWEIKNAAYYDRIYKADKAGKKERVAGMIEYLTLARNTKKETINEALRGLAKKDRDLSSEEKLKKQQEYGLKDGSGWIRDEYKAGRLDRKTAEKMYREAHPKMTDKQIRESFDKMDEQRKAGK